MTAELGLAALWGAAMLASLQLALSLGPVRIGDRALLAVRVLLTVASLVAFLAVFVDADVSVRVVAGRSAYVTTVAESLAAAWSGRAGQVLLWSSLFGIATLLQAHLEQDTGSLSARVTARLQAALVLALLTFLLLVVDPFARVGTGAPLPHPLSPSPTASLVETPALLLAYVGLTMAATIGVAAVWANTFSRAAARAMRSWTLEAWIALTIANIAAVGLSGGNRLFVPWLAATALLHALAVVAARGRLRRFPLRSREGALMGAAILLAATAGLLVLLPAGGAVVTPFVLTLAALLIVGPLLRWRGDRDPVWPRAAPAVAVAALALVISLLGAPTMSLSGRIALVLGIALIPASVTPLFLRPVRRLSLAAVGMTVAHLGVALALIGGASSTSFRDQRQLVMRPGETAAIGPWMVHFVDLLPAAGPGYTALEAHLEASRGEGLVQLLPQARYGEWAMAPYREDATIDNMAGQLSASFDGTRTADAVRLTLVWRPLASLMWLGGLTMAVGGVLALIGRAFAARRRRLDADDVTLAREWR